MTTGFLQYQLLQLCQNAIETCPFTDPVAGADCTNKFCTGFPAYIGVGTCVSLNEDPDNCCTSDDPTACLQNYAHGTGSGSGSSGSTPNVCASVLSILDTCFSATPALSPPASSLVSTSGPSATALANCVCYDSDGTYDPDTLDDFANECAASGSAAHPTYYPLVTPLQGFCTNNAGSAAATTPPAAAASTTPSEASATPVPASSAGSLASSTPSAASTTESLESASSSKGSTATSAGAGTTSGSGSSGAAAQTTTSKSSGVKITLRTSAILLLGFSVLLNF